MIIGGFLLCLNAIYKQDNNYSCGAYCIKMILKYYHLDIEIKEIKERCKVTNEGIQCLWNNQIF